MRTMPKQHQVEFEVHISSLVVLCRPDSLQAAVTEITSMPSAEVHAVDDCGKIIVVLETPSEENIINRINELEQIEGVISATLVYHQID